MFPLTVIDGKEASGVGSGTTIGAASSGSLSFEQEVKIELAPNSIKDAINSFFVFILLVLVFDLKFISMQNNYWQIIPT
jgi:hypothetical protein